MEEEPGREENGHREGGREAQTDSSWPGTQSPEAVGDGVPESLGVGTGRQAGGLRHTQGERADRLPGLASGAGWAWPRRGIRSGGQALGPRGSEQRPFPMWGPNLVLHTQGTEGDYRQTPGCPATHPQALPTLNPFPPRHRAQKTEVGT